MSEETPMSTVDIPVTRPIPKDVPTEDTIIEVEGGISSACNQGAATDNQTQTEVYIKKLELKVSGFIDLSGLVATFAVLVLLLSQPNRNEYFLPVLIFVFLSMIMQCILAVILVIRHNTVDAAEAHHHIVGGVTTDENNWYFRESRRLLFISSFSLMFIMIFNILIAAFVGLAGSPTVLQPDCQT